MGRKKPSTESHHGDTTGTSILEEDDDVTNELPINFWDNSQLDSESAKRPRIQPDPEVEDFVEVEAPTDS